MFFLPLNPSAALSVPTAIAAALVKSVGSDSLADSLLRSVNACLPTSHCSIFQVARDIASVVDVAGADARQSGAPQARAYLDSKFYADDPIWLEPCDADKAGLLFVRDVAEIASDSYRSNCYEVIGLAQRCSLIFPSGPSDRIALSFYCKRGFEGSELDLLQGLSTLLGAAVAQHIAIGAERLPSGRAQAFLARFNLTCREEQVLMLALYGLTNKEIARQLDLQPSTVVSYRDRAYRRLGIARHADLVKMMLFSALPILH